MQASIHDCMLPKLQDELKLGLEPTSVAALFAGACQNHASHEPGGVTPGHCWGKFLFCLLKYAGYTSSSTSTAHVVRQTNCTQRAAHPCLYKTLFATSACDRVLTLHSPMCITCTCIINLIDSQLPWLSRHSYCNTEVDQSCTQ